MGDKRERRGHFRGKPRPGRRVEVSFTVPGAATRRAFTRNIGVGGAFVETETPSPPGTPLTLALEVPTATAPLTIKGEVRWVVAQPADDVPAGMGIRFEPLDVEAALQLGEYFATLTGRES